MQTIARFEVRVSAYTLNDHISSCHLIWWQRGNMQEKHTVQMVRAHESSSRSQWVGEVCWQSEIHYLKYYFELIDNENRIFFADEYGISENPGTEQTAFELLQTHNENIISVPEWAKGWCFIRFIRTVFLSRQKLPTLRKKTGIPNLIRIIILAEHYAAFSAGSRI